MPEEILVKEALSKEMIESGRALIAALDSRNWPPECAFWLFDEERGGWSLVISSPDVEKRGPRYAVSLVDDLLAEKKDLNLTLWDISITPSHDRLVKAIRKRRFPAGTRIRGSGVDGEYVSEAFIYRA